MRFDVLVIGAELDGWVAAARLLELGHRVCVATPGQGSLHYAPGGLHVLGYVNGSRAQHVTAPFASINQLNEHHPYRLAGVDRTRATLSWFANSPLGVGFDSGDDHQRNSLVVTPAGLGLPALNVCDNQATIDQVSGKAVTVLSFTGHRDFPSGLLSAEFSRHGERITVVNAGPPGGRTDSVAIARAFDDMVDPDAWFAELRASLPKDTEVLLVPAVFGNRRSHEIIATAMRVLGCAVLEVPTLPPCLPGIRLNALCERYVNELAGTVRQGCRIAGMATDGDRVAAVTDSMGRVIDASAVILATGGVLMGGLDVDSHGRVSEPILGLDVCQTEPLSQADSEQAVDALHRAGIETDDSFRPRHNGSRSWRNVFVTGRNLAHWNPGAEISAEGVAIASGWLAAEATHNELGS